MEFLGDQRTDKPLVLAAANLKLFYAASRSQQEAEVALKKLSRPCNVLEKHLKDRPYVLGNRFTVADLNIAGVMTLALLCQLRSGTSGRACKRGFTNASTARLPTIGEA